VAEHFSWVHSLFDLRHARRLHEQRPPGLAPLKVCIQVNISREPGKGGLMADETADFVRQVRELARLEVCGLMCIPGQETDPKRQRAPFRALRELRDRLASPELPLSTLSMGMSGDLEAAIAEGSTLVRIGTAVFGPRPPRGT
jgi:pyridoxal phosphate enzyme (YggS family)